MLYGISKPVRMTLGKYQDEPALNVWGGNAMSKDMVLFCIENNTMSFGYANSRLERFVFYLYELSPDMFCFHW